MAIFQLSTISIKSLITKALLRILLRISDNTAQKSEAFHWKTSFFVQRKRRIQNLVKNLGWKFLRK